MNAPTDHAAVLRQMRDTVAINPAANRPYFAQRLAALDAALAALEGRQGEAVAVTDEIVAMLRASDAKGVREYGVTVDRADLSAAEWIDHAAGELGDAMKYLLALKRTLTAPPAAREVTDDALAALVAKWRESASGAKQYATTEFEDGCVAEQRRCADDLDALRASLRADSQPSSDERDAARWRFVRDQHQNWTDRYAVFNGDWRVHDELDAAIDAAMQAAAGEQPIPPAVNGGEGAE